MTAGEAQHHPHRARADRRDDIAHVMRTEIDARERDQGDRRDGARHAGRAAAPVIEPRDEKGGQHAVERHRGGGMAAWEAEGLEDEMWVLEARPQALEEALEHE